MIVFDDCIEWDVAERQDLVKWLNSINKFSGGDIVKRIDIVENYKDTKMTVLKIEKHDGVHLINISGNSISSILKELIRFLADGEKVTGYMGKEN